MMKTKPFRQAGLYHELSFLGSNKTAPDHLDMIAVKGFEEIVSEAFANCIYEHRREWDTLNLDGISSGSEVLNRLLGKFPEGSARRWDSLCPYILLPDNWDDYFSGRDASLRSSLRRREKRLQKDSSEAVRYHRVTRADELDKAMTELYGLHQKIRESQGDSGAFRHAGMREFHRRIAGTFLKNDRLRLSILKVGDRAIAASYCFRFRDVVCGYQSGYDPAWGKYSPGSAIVAHTIRASIEEGARELDMLSGGETYKSQWASLQRIDHNIQLATTLRGEFFLTLTRRLRNSWHLWKSRRSGKSHTA